MEAAAGPSIRPTDAVINTRWPLIQRLGSQRNKHKTTTLVVKADPALMQEVLVGGAVVSAVGAALFTGSQKEDAVCGGCGGTGGILCFACSGSGTMESAPLEKSVSATTAINRRDPLGRNVDPRECTACKGCGKLLCKRCNGSGYC